MPLEQTILYRGLLRELRLSISTPRKVNKDIKTHFRSLVELCRHDKAKRDLENAILFLKSQREHKRLLERYHPWFDLTAEERIEATARRVGLNMPITHKP